MNDVTLAILERIEAHLCRIADAASERVKRATSREASTVRARAITDADRPTEAHHLIAKRLGIDIAIEWPKFKAYCQAHNARYVNFDAAFRKWLLNNQKRVV